MFSVFTYPDPLVQSPEESVKTKEIHKGCVFKGHIYSQLLVIGKKRATEKGIQR
jgi:hypothetical protein